MLFQIKFWISTLCKHVLLFICLRKIKPVYHQERGKKKVALLRFNYCASGVSPRIFNTDSNAKTDKDYLKVQAFMF